MKTKPNKKKINNCFPKSMLWIQICFVFVFCFSLYCFLIFSLRNSCDLKECLESSCKVSSYIFSFKHNVFWWTCCSSTDVLLKAYKHDLTFIECILNYFFFFLEIILGWQKSFKNNTESIFLSSNPLPLILMSYITIYSCQN